MILSVSINAYEYKDLDHKAQRIVIRWLDLEPLEYQDEKGVFHYAYFSDGSDIDIEEHCLMNEYLFDKNGRPIHDLIIK
jgi:hypothetical protein